MIQIIVNGASEHQAQLKSQWSMFMEQWVEQHNDRPSECILIVCQRHIKAIAKGSERTRP